MITFDHVTYTYEGQTVPSLRDCSFTVEPGELILFTGESGCGKTTLLNVIGGLDRFQSGSLTVDGKDIRRDTDVIRNQLVGYILSEDPTYITNYNNARSLICRIDRDELLQELVRSYLEDKE